MRTLAIDCSTEMCSVALFDGDRLVASEGARLGRGHAERLVPMIAALPGAGKADRIAVALGPGSFTGVRVGLAAARALALAWKAQLVGYPTLALIAAMARDRLGKQPISVAITGGHGEWFVQDFTAAGDAANALASLPPPAAAAYFSSEVIAGTQAEAAAALRGSGTALPLWPDASAFALLDARMLCDEPRPIYGRAPDARLPATP